MTSSRPVLVAGWVGSTNAGDELIHAALLSELRGLGLEPRTVSRDPAATHRAHDVAAFPTRRLWRELGSAGWLVFGGGGLIQQDSSLLNTGYHLARLRAARLRRVPALAVGLGVATLRTPTARHAVRRELRRLRRVVVRDADSQAVLRALGVPDVRLGCDLVFTFRPPATPAEDTIAVSLRPAPAGGVLPAAVRRPPPAPDWLAAVAGALDAAALGTGLTVRFIALDPERDHPVHRAVADRMTTSVHTEMPDFDAVIPAMARARVTVGMRLHASITSLVAGRPAVALGYAQKVTSLAAEAKGAVVGLGADAVGVRQIPRAVGDALARSDRVPEAVAAQRARHAENRSALALLVEP